MFGPRQMAPGETARLQAYAHPPEALLSHYRALLDRDELDPQAHNNLGLLFRDRGMLDQAVREFRRALIIDAEDNFSSMLARPAISVTRIRMSLPTTVGSRWL